MAYNGPPLYKDVVQPVEDPHTSIKTLTTILSSTCESPYPERQSLYWDRVQDDRNTTISLRFIISSMLPDCYESMCFSGTCILFKHNVWYKYNRVPLPILDGFCSAFPENYDNPVFAYGQRTPDSKIMRPTWGPSGADRTQVGPMLAPWTLLYGTSFILATMYDWFISSNMIIR